MKNFKALAATALVAGTGLLATGCADLDPNTVKITFQDEEIGHFHCVNKEFKPLNTEIANGRWLDAQELMAAAVTDTDILEEHGGFGLLGGALFVGALFERGEEICAEQGIGQEEKAAPVVTESIRTAPPVRPVTPVAPVAPSIREMPAPQETRNTFNFNAQDGLGRGEATHTPAGKDTKEYNYFVEQVSDAMFQVTWSDGLKVMYTLYVDGTAEITVREGNKVHNDAAQWSQDGTDLVLVSHTGSVTRFGMWNF